MTFGTRLRARAVELPFVVVALAAVDAALVRIGHPHHPAEAVLFAHALFLWGSFGLAALLPAAMLLRRRAGDLEAGRGLGGALGLSFFLLAPIAAHQALDRHTAANADARALFLARPWIELAAVVVLLAVVHVVVARLTRRVPRGRAALAVLVLALPVGLFLPRNAPLERHTSVPAALEEKPNVLLLVWDTTRASSLATYGYDRATTPALARLAEESLVFEEARSVSVFTFTSHLSMLTGKYPGATGARLARMRVDHDLAESVAVTFDEAGYRTGAFVGTWVLAGNSGFQRGFQVYDDRVDPDVSLTYGWKLVHDVQALLAGKLGVLTRNGLPHWFQDFQRPGSEVLERALAWIENGDPRPWFCMVNLYDAHWPYLPREDSRERWVSDYDGPVDGYLYRSDDYPDGYVPDAADARHLAQLYDAELWELDARVDAFLGELDLDRTAVLLTSDHGEAFGEAGVFEHKDVFEPQVRIPMLVRATGPSAPRGTRSTPTSGVDVAPTLLALAGLPVPDGLHGLDLLDPGLPAEREVLVEDRDYGEIDERKLVLYSGRHKLVRVVDGDEVTLRLYDLASDPVGEVDLAGDEPDRARELDRRLTELRAPWADVDAGMELTGMGASADALGGLGYLGGDED